MDDGDIDLRNHTYRQFVERGRAPSASEIANVLGVTTAAVKSGWLRLHSHPCER